MRKYQTGVVILPIIIVVLIILVTGFFVYQSYQPKKNQPIAPSDPRYLETNSTQTPHPTNSLQQTNSNITLPVTECSEYVDMLETCTKYTCEFTHPLTGDELTREIIGMVNGKCNSTDELPNNGQMNCSFTEEMRVAVAQSYKEIAEAESLGFGFSGEFSPENTEINSTITIDGKTVDNPLQKALSVGQCEVIGYE